MKRFLYSEILKIKSSRTNHLLIFIPLFAITLSFLVGGLQIFETFSIYWWEASFLFLLFSLLFVYDCKAEKRAGNFQNITIGSMEWNIYLSKIMLIFFRVVFANIIFAFLLYLFSFVYQGIIIVDFLRVMITLSLILISAMWNVPFLYVLSKNVNGYVLLAINTLSCFLISPFLAQTSVWFLFPYTYHYKVAEVLMNIKPSGDLITSQNEINFTMLFEPIILSVIVIIILLFLLRKKINHAKK